MTTIQAQDHLSYASFLIEDQWLGIPNNEVQEIIPYQRVSSVPLTPKSITGILNLRGQIVIAIDLRERLGFTPKEPDYDTMNIIVKEEEELFSLIVDSVGDVLKVKQNTFSAPPPTLDPMWKKCCSGVHKLEKDLLVVANVSALVQIDFEFKTSKNQQEKPL